MRREFKDGVTAVTGLECFSIRQTLECGQCFRFKRIREEEGACEYAIAAFDRVLRIRQDDTGVYFYPTGPDEFGSIWAAYFDLDTDYPRIREELSRRDEWIRKAADEYGGIRILRQQPWECLVSFILSQNNKIERIKSIIQNITERFGEPLADGYYAFPSPDTLAGASVDELLACKAGFRAKYLADAAKKVSNGEVVLESLYDAPMEDARAALMGIKGVGEKIADCVLLFSLGKSGAFPADVWIKRVIRELYFGGGSVSYKTIGDFANERFGEHAGLAQEYLYAYAREHRIGV